MKNYEVLMLEESAKKSIDIIKKYNIKKPKIHFSIIKNKRLLSIAKLDIISALKESLPEGDEKEHTDITNKFLNEEYGDIDITYFDSSLIGDIELDLKESSSLSYFIK